MPTPLKFSLSLILLSLLTACGPLSIIPPVTPTPTIDLRAVYTQSLATAVVRLTQTAAPSPTPTLLSGELPFFSFQGDRVVFAQDGQLFFQQDDNPPVLLSKAQASDLFHERIISDDGQKIVFLRGKTSKTASAYADVYAVNADGSGEELLITPQWLATLSKGTGRGAALPVFVPGTHKVLFETSLCQSPAKDAPCSTGIFLADADGGETKVILPPGTAQPPSPTARFKVSPDGKLFALASSGHVDILDTNGQLVRGGAFIYTPSTSETLYPALFWLSDSSGLIAALPTNTFHISAYDKDVAAYAIWRYTLADSHAEAIPLDPSPMNLQGEADQFLVSPDGNWLLYGGNGPSASDIYLGNLHDEHVQRVGDNPQPFFSWSPDSKRFFGQNFAGVIGERVAQVSKKNFDVLFWINAAHFLCRFCGETDSKPHIAELDGETIRYYRLPPAMAEDAYLLIVSK